MKAKATGDQWTRKQLHAIKLLGEGECSLDYIAAEVGTSRNTIWKWRQNPLFAEAVISRAKSGLQAIVPEVYQKLAEVAMTGDVQAIKALLAHIESAESKNNSYAGSITFEWKGKWDEADSTIQNAE